MCLLSLSLNRVAEHCHLDTLLLLDTVPSKQIHIQLINIPVLPKESERRDHADSVCSIWTLGATTSPRLSNYF